MLDPAALHRELFLIDTHADTPQRLADEGWNFRDELKGGHLNLAAARSGNLGAEFFALWPEPSEWKGRSAHRTLVLLDAVLETVRRNPADLVLCLSVDDIVAARAAKRFGILLGIEGGHAIENSLALLRLYYALGVRYMTLTWANSNDWADSSGDLEDPSISHHGGLTPFGRAVIREMNRLGMMVDVSHTSDATFRDVLSTASAPVLASHSSARALTAAPRNLSDEMLRALAANGGACMVNFYPAFIDETWRTAWNALTPERLVKQQSLAADYHARGLPVPHHASNRVDQEFASRLPRPPLHSLINHIDHVARVAGIDHVGLGSDFDGICALPEGIDSAADLPRITAALVARGYDAISIGKIMGGNLLRIMRAVEAATRRASARG